VENFGTTEGVPAFPISAA